jgi:hypothetical protein
MTMPIKLVAALALASSVLFTTGQAEARHYRFCFYWHTLTADNSADIDYLKDEPLSPLAPGGFPDDHRASGARYTIGVFPPKIPVPGGYADQDGCVDFESETNGNIYVNMYAEQRLELDNDEVVTVRSFPTQWFYDQWFDSTKNWTKVPKTIFLLNGSDYGGCGDANHAPCLINLKPTVLYSEIGNIQATAVATLQRLTELVDLPFNFNYTELNLLGEDCPGYAHNSCAANPIRIAETGCESQNPAYACHSRYKFVIGHEVGHWIQGLWAGSMPSGYGDTGGGADDFAACWSEAGDLFAHLLFSREHAGAAFNEGFAHFMSTLVFNDVDDTTAYFDYYKDYSGIYSGANLQTLNASHGSPDIAEDIDPGGVICNVCGGSSSKGTEYDWLAFYWAYLTTGNDASQPTVVEILTHLDAAIDDADGEHSQVYGSFPNTVQGSFADRWDDLSAQFGVDGCQ